MRQGQNQNIKGVAGLDVKADGNRLRQKRGRKGNTPGTWLNTSYARDEQLSMEDIPAIVPACRKPEEEVTCANPDAKFFGTSRSKGKNRQKVKKPRITAYHETGGTGRADTMTFRTGEKKTEKKGLVP